MRVWDVMEECYIYIVFLVYIEFILLIEKFIWKFVDM